MPADCGLRVLWRLRGPLPDEWQTDLRGSANGERLVHSRAIHPATGLYSCTYVIAVANGDIVLKGLDPRGPDLQFQWTEVSLTPAKEMQSA
jgi:hypothetical protein